MNFWGKARAAFGTKTAAGPASPQDVFAAEVEAAARAIPSVTSVQRTAQGFGLRITRSGKQCTLFLDNIFAETRDIDPQGRRERIARLLRTMDAPDPAEMDWVDVRRKLAPLLRTPSLFGSFPPTQAKDTWPINRPFAPFLVECVGVDSEDGIRYVTPSLISTLDADRSEVFAAAIENGRKYFVDDIQSYDSDARIRYGTSHATIVTSLRVFSCPGGSRPFRAKSRVAPWPSCLTADCSSSAVMVTNAASGG